MAESRSRAGGHVNWTFGEKITTADLIDMGSMAEQYVGFLAGLLFRDKPNNEERSGFLGNSCLVTVSAGLTMSIAAGVGWYDDEAESDAYAPVVKPIVVPVAVTTTLAAHDATNPRIDLICLAPGTTEEDSQSRNVIDPTSGSVSAQSVDKKVRNFYMLSVTTGTPAASPSAPSTPSGYIAIAQVRVPAVSGAVTITDVRPLLQISEDLVTPPPTEYHEGWVPGTSTELQVTASSPASMVLQVAAGSADVRGTRVQIPAATTVTIGASHASLTRYDLVVVYDTGTVGVYAGTAGSGVPTLPSNAALLATVTVAALATSIGSGAISDDRARQPYTGDYLADLSIPAAKLVKVPCLADVTVGTESGDVINVQIQWTDPDGEALPTGQETVKFKAELVTMEIAQQSSGNYQIAIVTGSRITSTTGIAAGFYASAILQSDSNGYAEIDVTGPAGASKGTFLVLTPLNRVGAVSYVDLPFN